MTTINIFSNLSSRIFHSVKKTTKKTNRFALLLFIGGAFLFLHAGYTARAATFTVTKTADTDDGVCNTDCSLREAVAAANAAPTDDIINFNTGIFSTARTITLNGTVLTVLNSGKLAINGSGAELLTISGNDASRVFFIETGANTTFNNLKITNGNAADGRDGGGVFVNINAVFTLNNSIISNCKGPVGGGGGGGIATIGTTTVNNSVIDGNVAPYGGGGILTAIGVLTLNNSAISNNSANANAGGGIFISNGSAVIKNSTIDGNFSAGKGGGIFNAGTLTAANITVTSNASGNGAGGLSNFGSQSIVNLSNSTISSNTTSAESGGGLLNTGGTVNARNTIFANNSVTGTAAAPDFSGTLNSQGYNLIENTSGAIIFGTTTGNITGQDPLLGDLQYNGGRTRTRALLTGSPAIDAADADNFSAFDQRGASRPLDGDANGSHLPDIGAFEAGAKIVTKIADTNDGICGTDCSLREAITEANNSAADDAIIFSEFFNAARTITLSNGDLIIAGGGGALTIVGSGADALSISGNNVSRVFYIGDSATVLISDLRVTRGNGVGTLYTVNEGGGIYADFKSTVTFNNLLVSNNSAFGGGGIANGGGTMRINNSTISSNSATTSPGGGGILNTREGSLTINNSFISGSSTTGGGGGVNNSIGSTLNLVDSTVNNNFATGLGGVGGGIANFGAANISNSTVNNNSVGQNGGGILAGSGVVTITNSTIAANSAILGGGGIRVLNDSAVNLINATISNNTSSGGSGGGIQNSGTVNSRNSIVADNTGAAAAPDFSGIFISEGYNLIENTQGAAITGITTGNILGRDPQLTPLRSYGGVTASIALQPTSPAIDAADPNNFPPTDQRGILRPQDGDLNGISLPDIGAYERQVALFTVTKPSDSNDNVCNADCSLREAITAANTAATPDNAILFAPAVFNSSRTIWLDFSYGQLNISNSGTLYIYGTGADLLTISAKNLHRVLFIETGAVVAIDGLTIAGGNDQTSDGFCGGGGILIQGVLNLTNSTVTNNTSNLGGGGICTRSGSRVNIVNSSFFNNNARSAGGAIYNNAGLINIKDSAVTANTSEIDGGGISNAGTMTLDNVRITENTAARGSGGFENDSTATVTNSVINNNRANTGGAGGLSNGGSLTISNTSISSNSAAREGAGISNGSTLNASHLIIAGNHSNLYGGGIYSSGASVMVNISNSTISGNTASGSNMNDGNGGGIYNISIMTLTNSTVSGNTVSATSSGESGLGGGIFNGRTLNLTNVTVANNTSPRGGGGVRNGSQFYSSSTVNARNTIIADNSSSAVSADFDGVLNSQGYNLIENTNGTTVSGTATGNIIGQDPKLGALSNNGGFTQTRGLLLGSPAIDAADPNNFPLTDQRGLARPKDGDGNGTLLPDIGAFERQFLQNVAFDFDGDGKADISTFRPSDGVWYLNHSSQGFTGIQFGISTDKLAPADYDGDGKTDLAVFRDGNWFLLRSQTGFINVRFGTAGDLPQSADFDGDGRAELAVFRPSNGTWYVLNLITNQFSAAQFGNSSDKPVAADYDGDGKADYAVYRPETGMWYLLGSQSGFIGVQFGISTDKPVASDYDGDGKTDLAVYRDGVWYLLRSQQGFTSIQFGLATDVPAPADYDGDGKADPAVFREGSWYLQQSTRGGSSVQFGASGDKPVPSAFIP